MDMDPRFHPAQAAMAAGDVDRLAALLAAEPDLAKSRSTRSHPTLLQCLVLTKPPVDTLEDLIKLLAAHGAELAGPLVAAAGPNNVRAIKTLLDLGAPVDGTEQWTPLEEALYWGNEEAVSLLLERGAAAGNLRTFAALGDMEAVAECFDQSAPCRCRRRDRLAVQSQGHPGGNTPRPGADHQQCPRLRRGLGSRRRCRVPARSSRKSTPFPPASITPAQPCTMRPSTAASRLGHAALAPWGRFTVPDAKIGKLAKDWASHGGHEALAERLRRIRLPAP